MVNDTTITLEIPYESKPGYVIIYGLFDPRTDTLRYIGKTANPAVRFHQHVHNNRGKLPVDKWISQLKSIGMRPTYKTIDEVPALEWEHWEMFYIAHYIANGESLTNVTDGGQRNTNKQIAEKISNTLSHEWCIVFPDDKIEIIKNLSKFCRDRGFSRRAFHAVANGEKHTAYGHKCFRIARDGTPIIPVIYLKSKGYAHSEREKSAGCRFWIVTNPDGDEISISNLKQFCRENDLIYASMIFIANGRINQHRGWKCKKLDTGDHTSN